jgi:hypothetical protein
VYLARTVAANSHQPTTISLQPSAIKPSSHQPSLTILQSSRLTGIGSNIGQGRCSAPHLEHIVKTTHGIRRGSPRVRRGRDPMRELCMCSVTPPYYGQEGIETCPIVSTWSRATRQTVCIRGQDMRTGTHRVRVCKLSCGLHVFKGSAIPG